jgi:phosphotransferase system HPr (HPr) family protein
VPASSEAAHAASVRLPEGVDLHARPAGEFVRTAMQFSASIWIALDEREVDAKSLLSILALGAKGGSTLGLRAEGSDAAAALDTLCATIAGWR